MNTLTEKRIQLHYQSRLILVIEKFEAELLNIKGWIKAQGVSYAPLAVLYKDRVKSLKKRIKKLRKAYLKFA